MLLECTNKFIQNHQQQTIDRISEYYEEYYYSEENGIQQKIEERMYKLDLMKFDTYTYPDISPHFSEIRGYILKQITFFFRKLKAYLTLE